MLLARKGRGAVSPAFVRVTPVCRAPRELQATTGAGVVGVGLLVLQYAAPEAGPSE